MTFTRVVLTAALAGALAACAGVVDPPAPSAVEAPPAECPRTDSLVVDLDNPIPQELADRLVGLSEERAETCAVELGWGFRVAERDGEPFALTADYRPDRVSVFVAAGRVFAVNVG